MLMNETIRKMFVEDGLTPQQIADALDFDILAVETVLASYRDSANKKIPGTGRSVKEDLEIHRDAAIAALGELASGAENEGVRLKAAVTTLEFLHGQRDPKKLMPRSNIEEVDKLVSQAAARYAQMKKIVTQVEETKKLLDV